jgi:hypothetical protein
MSEQTQAPEKQSEGGTSQEADLLTPTPSEGTGEADSTETAADTVYGEDETDGEGEGEGQQEADDTEADGDEDSSSDDGESDGESEGAPESYDEFRVPDGVESLDAGTIATFEEAAREANLTQEQAQAFLDKMAPAQVQAQLEQRNALLTEWREASATDKEFGGARFKANLAVAQKGFERFFDAKGQQLLQETGLVNHPELVRAMYRAGKAISEDTFVGASGAGSKETSIGKGDVFKHDPQAAADALYD